MALSENLPYLRTRHNLTQEQLAEKLEVSRQSVSKWESGASYPEMETILKLCDIFHIDMDTLLRGSAEKSLSEDSAGYDRFMNLFSLKVAGAVAGYIVGAAAMGLCNVLGLSEMVSMVLLLAAVCLRIFVIPRFQYVPGKLQLLLEEVVGLFDRMSQASSPHRFGFLGAYIFAAGSFIFTGTLFELLGLQAITVHGHPVTLPAPLSDINSAIALGTLSYLVILSGGIASNGLQGVRMTLKEFSLPISMSFRLFGALLSGLLVTELVYYYISLSFVLPVVVGVLFTLLHALIQTYVLTMLTALYYGEVSEKPKERKKKPKKKWFARHRHK